MPNGKLAIIMLMAILLINGCTVDDALVTAPAPPALLTTIAFGSCANQSKPQPIWTAVNATQPDLFIFLGDNIYADTDDMAMMRARYALLGAQPGYQQLRRQSSVIATWDDHDYGRNDAGAEYAPKATAKQIFLDFFGEPANSERRLQDGGIYTAYTYGPPGQRVQVILLDTRWDRSPLTRVPEAEAAALRRESRGPYLPTTDPNAQLLGAAQWQWLETQLRAPADLRLIATSIPLLRSGTGWETWSNFPAEQQRLIDLITTTHANGVLFLTGDTHHAQFSLRTEGVPYPFWEVNSSGLTENVTAVAPDASLIGDVYLEDNYGLLHIDWEAPDPVIAMTIHDVSNTVVLQQQLELSELQME